MYYISDIPFNNLSTELKIRAIQENFYGYLDLRFVGKRDDINLFRIYESYHNRVLKCYGSTYIIYSDTGVLSKSFGTPCLEVVYIDNTKNLSKCKILRNPLKSRIPIAPFLNSLELDYPYVWKRVSEESFKSKKQIREHQKITLTSDYKNNVTEGMILKISSVEPIDANNFKYTVTMEVLDIYSKNFIGHDEILEMLWFYRESRV